MKRFIPFAIAALVLTWFVATLMPRRSAADFNLRMFGELPALADGRVKPFDTIARTGLLMIQGRQRLVSPQGATIEPDAWLLDVLFNPAKADSYAIFRIDNSEVLTLFGLAADAGQGKVRFSYDQLRNGVDELERQAELADAVDASIRTAFQRGVVELREHVQYYGRLKFTFQTPDSPDFYRDAIDRSQAMQNSARFKSMDSFGLLRPIVPRNATGDWKNAGRALMADSETDEGRVQALTFASLGRAWQGGLAVSFNELVAGRLAEDRAAVPSAMWGCYVEATFNRAEPFYLCMILYVAAFLAAILSWLRWPKELGQVAISLMVVAFVVATLGIVLRMVIEGRPPVTNLYSSALFIGWGSVGLCVVMELLYRNAVASAAGCLLGFGTLVIAHHLSLSGDTMEMMRAVLDSNFWLSTHVVTVTVGYAATFLAGFLALIYVIRGVFTKSLDRKTADTLARMVYGIVCFATFFSFVGTVLGGIWADQSWGRFWGWDPKENGALIIVLWNSVILHSRWAGFTSQRGLMALAIAGNIVTAWSWFGTNMLGVGLHSYGFTNEAFVGLLIFVCAQLAVIALSSLPNSRWRSFLALQRQGAK